MPKMPTKTDSLYVRVGDVTNKKQLVFYKDEEGTTCFNPRVGIRFDFGVMFDPERGYRVFFNYFDTPELKSTWGPLDLKRWAESITITNDDEQTLYEICHQQAGLAIWQNDEWKRLGYPEGGVPEKPATGESQQ